MMTITKYYKHKGHISEISRRYNIFSRLSNARLASSTNREWKDTQSGILSNEHDNGKRSANRNTKRNAARIERQGKRISEGA